MKIRLDTIPQGKYPRLYEELHRQDRADTVLWWIGAVGLVVALVTIISLFIGLGNMAAVVAQIGGAL